MKIRQTFLLILVSSLGSLALEDLKQKTLVFPEASNTAHVILRPVRQQPLTNFTVCLRSYTDLSRGHSLFSYATRKAYNELLVYKHKPNQYSLYVGGSMVTFSIADNPVPKPLWEHICVSWESVTGIAELWLNGVSLPRKGMKRGYTIGPEASIVLGQEQDSFGGGFDINESFTGEISDVFMWDRVLSSQEVVSVRYGDRLSNYLIDWQSLNYEIKGYVVVKPSTFSSS
ncbi:PREDICTED: serum amyloid P-component [Gekko japonicus]|uniref:Pentraxin family member n=1 Tax=Gekko japonicus TaxID=146911 RepID=A0ABM1L399_GEKJA|nr:PREDICTED: serum amyloid P-component [Gekko japonicus]